MRNTFLQSTLSYAWCIAAVSAACAGDESDAMSGDAVGAAGEMATAGESAPASAGGTSGVAAGTGGMSAASNSVAADGGSPATAGQSGATAMSIAGAGAGRGQSQAGATAGQPEAGAMSTAGTSSEAAGSEAAGSEAAGSAADMPSAGTGGDVAGENSAGDEAAVTGSTFTEVYALFGDKCAGATCHVGAARAAAGLDMPDRATAYMNLVDADSTACAGEKRVVAGEPDSSELIHTLKHTSIGMCARTPQMPAGNNPMLSSMEIDMVVSWIAAGAQDD